MDKVSAEAFLLRADENAEMIVDAGLDTIREAWWVTHPGEPLPDPFTISHRNARLLLLAAFKAGATFGFEEVIEITRKLQT